MFGANVPELLASAETVEAPATNRSRISGTVKFPLDTPKTAASAGYVDCAYVPPSRNSHPVGAVAVAHIVIAPVGMSAPWEWLERLTAVPPCESVPDVTSRPVVAIVARSVPPISNDNVSSEVM